MAGSISYNRNGNAPDTVSAAVPYLTDSLELTAVADAIRARGGTSAPLVYPDGFISAVAAIPAGGGGDEDGIVDRTVSGAYENSRVAAVGAYAFYGCSSLTSVSFPACSSVGGYAFDGCTGLLAADFSSCTGIGSYAFYGCTKLAAVSFPACTTLSASAFYNCQKLQSAVFPRCTSIASSAFYNCYALSTADFPLCESVASGAFTNCSSLAGVSFPNLKTVGVSAFTSCRSLSSVRLPACRSISSNAFLRCYRLVSLYLPGTSVVSLPYSNAFSSTPIGGYSASAGQFGSIYVQASLVSAYRSAAGWSWFSSRITAI